VQDTTEIKMCRFIYGEYSGTKQQLFLRVDMSVWIVSSLE